MYSYVLFFSLPFSYCMMLETCFHFLPPCFVLFSFSWRSHSGGVGFWLALCAFPRPGRFPIAL